MRYTCLSDIALFINGIETVKAYRFRVAITIYAVHFHCMNHFTMGCANCKTEPFLFFREN